MTLDCPFRNPLQSRVIPVRSCYLTSFCVPLFLQNGHIPHPCAARLDGTTSSQPFLLSPLLQLSPSYVRLPNVGVFLPLSAVDGMRIPCAGARSDRMWLGSCGDWIPCSFRFGSDSPIKGPCCVPHLGSICVHWPLLLETFLGFFAFDLAT